MHKGGTVATEVLGAMTVRQNTMHTTRHITRQTKPYVNLVPRHRPPPRYRPRPTNACPNSGWICSYKSQPPHDGRRITKLDIYKRSLRFGYQLTTRLIRGERNNTTGVWIRDQLLDMGPTYVKIGQIVSSRPDLFPEYIVDELEKLQDKVPSFTFDQVKQVFREEFAFDIASKFKTFSVSPIASASIGQVHLGTLKNGKRVAIKVQRPTIRDNFKDDLEVISNILNILRGLNNKNVNDVILVLNECTKSIEQEVDFQNEKTNMLIFNKIFWADDDVVIPRVYSKMTSSRVLVMEYVPGIKINDVHSLSMVAVDTNGLARTLMSMFIRIILKHGYLHCDPHAGNISVTPEGQIILYDYGLVTRFSRDFQDTFRQILFAFFDQNTVEVMELILKNRILYATESKATSVAQITDNEYVVFYKLVEYIFDYTRTLDITTLTQNITTDDYIDVNHIPLVFDSKMVLLFKTMTTLEGICKQLDPNFNYNRIILSMVTEVVDTTFLMDRAMTDIDDIMKTTRIKEFVDFIRTNFESPYTSESTTANGTASRTASGNVNGEWNTDQVMMTTTDLLRQAMRRRPGGNPMGVQIDKDRLLNARLGKMEKRMESERTMGAIGVGLVALINMLFTN